MPDACERNVPTSRFFQDRLDPRLQLPKPVCGSIYFPRPFQCLCPHCSPLSGRQISQFPDQGKQGKHLLVQPLQCLQGCVFPCLGVALLDYFQQFLPQAGYLCHLPCRRGLFGEANDLVNGVQHDCRVRVERQSEGAGKKLTRAIQLPVTIATPADVTSGRLVTTRSRRGRESFMTSAPGGVALHPPRRGAPGHARSPPFGWPRGRHPRWRLARSRRAPRGRR